MSNTKWSKPASRSKSATKEKKKDNFQLELKPMPEIELIDPITGKLPKNYKQILAEKDKKLQNANGQSTSKEIIENKFEFSLKPMPEIALLDPVTGQLPKNYKEILAAKSSNGQSTSKEIIETNKFEFSLKPMPEIALLDPVTGQLPKNYEEILAAKSCNTRRSKDFDFQRSKVRSGDSTLSKAGQTRYRNTKIGPRKALFTNPKGTTKHSPKNGLPRKSIKIQNSEVNESVLLDIEETERQLFYQKKPSTFTAKFPKPHATPVQKITKSQRKRSASSGSSLEEFLKLEQQTKTPKSTTAAKRKKNIDLATSIQEISIKLNENKDLMNKIVMNHNQINNNLQEILECFHKNNIKENSLDLDNAIKNASSTDETEEDKENILKNLVPLQPSVRSNLRVIALKNNFEKKVLFNLEIDNCDSPLRKKDFGSQTPNTMLRSVTRRARQQLLALQDTPKSSL